MSNKSLLTLGIFIFLLVTLPLALLLTQVSQELRKAGAEERPRLVISPSSGEITTGEELTLNLLPQNFAPFDALDVAVDLSNLTVKSVTSAPLPEGASFLIKPHLQNNQLRFSLEFPFDLKPPSPLVTLVVKGVATCAPAKASFNPDFTLLAVKGAKQNLEFADAKFTIKKTGGDLRLTSSSNLEAVVGVPFSHTLTTSTLNPDELTVVFEGLPDWLTQNTVTLSGTPPEPGEHQFKIFITDIHGSSFCGEIKLKVYPEGAALVNFTLRFEGKKEARHHFPLSLKVKETNASKSTHTNGLGQGSVVFENLQAGKNYTFVTKGYQNLSVKRSCNLGRTQSACSLDFGLLPAGDIAPRETRDDFVNSLDFSLMVSEWNLEEERESIADFNSDFRVNTLDYSILLNNFGKKGED